MAETATAAAFRQALRAKGLAENDVDGFVKTLKVSDMTTNDGAVDEQRIVDFAGHVTRAHDMVNRRTDGLSAGRAEARRRFSTPGVSETAPIRGTGAGAKEAVKRFGTTAAVAQNDVQKAHAAAIRGGIQ